MLSIPRRARGRSRPWCHQLRPGRGVRVFCYTFFKGVAAKPAHLPREGSNGRDV